MTSPQPDSTWELRERLSVTQTREEIRDGVSLCPCDRCAALRRECRDALERLERELAECRTCLNCGVNIPEGNRAMRDPNWPANTGKPR